MPKAWLPSSPLSRVWPGQSRSGGSPAFLSFLKFRANPPHDLSVLICGIFWENVECPKMLRSLANLFRGISEASIDTKGRLSLPHRFREALSPSPPILVITIDVSDRCLLVYSIYEWELVQKKLEVLSNASHKNRILQRLLIGHAIDLEMDKSGRILLPNIHRKYALLKNKVTILGQGNKLEVWAEDEWQEQMTSWLDKKDKLLDPGEDAANGISI